MKKACMKHKLYAVLSTYSLSISSAVSVTGSLCCLVYLGTRLLSQCVTYQSVQEVEQKLIRTTYGCDLYNNSPTALLSLQITGC